MSSLVWHSEGAGIVAAWHREDGTSLRCVLTIEHVAWPYAFRIRAHRPGESAFDPILLTLQLRHSDIDLVRAKQLAEILEPEFPALQHDEPTMEQLLDAHRRQLAATEPPRPQRCQFVHAWPHGAGDSTACLCGTVTKGFARVAGLKVPA